ncbi:MAG: DUF692 domain-containing protein [Pseudomonadota bacterium]
MLKASNQKPITLPGPIHQDPVGIGLRHAYYEGVVETKPKVGWLEVHPENYFGGGANRYHLEKARELYDISFHAVGLSLGSADGLDGNHLQEIKDLIDIYEPFQFSDHASWSASGNAHLNDLLPLPYTEESLNTVVENVNRTQDFFGRQILTENPSSYIAFADNDMEEYDFMNEIAARTGCKILLDINNIYVQAHNHKKDPYEYIAAIKPGTVGEMHLAGFSEFDAGNNQTILIDTHSNPVHDPVWDLYAFGISKHGQTPTLIEWDEELPPLQTLVNEADKARYLMFKTLDIAHAAE